MQGCICPHPPLLIPEVGGASLRRVSATVAALRRLAAEVGEPETVVVMSPHSSTPPSAISRMRANFLSRRSAVPGAIFRRGITRWIGCSPSPP